MKVQANIIQFCILANDHAILNSKETDDSQEEITSLEIKTEQILIMVLETTTTGTTMEICFVTEQKITEI